jgi:hypothetical protein
MTPTQKAEELVKKFFEFNHRFKWDSDNDEWTHDYYLAKECALITVDEILDNAGMIWSGIYTETGMTAKGEIRKKYWQEVKQKLEKL